MSRMILETWLLKAAAAKSGSIFGLCYSICMCVCVSVCVSVSVCESVCMMRGYLPPQVWSPVGVCLHRAPGMQPGSSNVGEGVWVLLPHCAGSLPQSNPTQLHLPLTQNQPHTHTHTPFSPAPSLTLHIVYHPPVLTCRQSDAAKKNKVYQVSAVSCLCATLFVCFIKKENNLSCQGVWSMNILYVFAHMLWWYFFMCVCVCMGCYCMFSGGLAE